MKSPHINDPKKLGHHGLIEVYGGEVNWDEQFSSEMKHQAGKLLVAGMNSYDTFLHVCFFLNSDLQCQLALMCDVQ